jgi:hypothetical protein
LSVDGDASRDFTETHQVLLRTERGQGEFMSWPICWRPTT